MYDSKPFCENENGVTWEPEDIRECKIQLEQIKGVLDDLELASLGNNVNNAINIIGAMEHTISRVRYGY